MNGQMITERDRLKRLVNAQGRRDCPIGRIIYFLSR